MKRTLLIKMLCTPFLEELCFFISTWMSISFIEVVAWCCYGNTAFGLYLALHGFIYTYGIVLMKCLLNETFHRKKISVLYTTIIYVLGICNIITDIICHYNFHFGFTSEVVDIIRGTNVNESLDFIQTFFGIYPILFTFSIVSLFFIINLNKKKISKFAHKYNKPIVTVGYLVLLLSISSTTIRHSNNWNGIFVNKLFMLYKGGSVPTPELCKYKKKKRIKENEVLPQKVVIIIGESHSQRHSSLYGYSKNTEPLLSRREQGGNLFVYKNVESPAVGTITSFIKILNSSLAEGLPDSLWYKSSTIFDVAEAAGYKATWISNQDRKGMYDNVPASYAELCDTSLWAGKKFMDAGRMNQDGNYDQIVIDLYKSINQHDANELFVFHLMGSHEAFKNRYPPKYSQFKASDYPDKEESQREIISEYDNSILYNDYIINEIIALFEDTDALMLYFSDHSLDIFDSSQSFYGHARKDKKSIEAGKCIPFFVYLSPKYKELRPNKEKQIIQELDIPFNTGFFYRKLCQLLDIEVY